MQPEHLHISRLPQHPQVGCDTLGLKAVMMIRSSYLQPHNTQDVIEYLGSLRSKPVPETEEKDSVFAQVQIMFANLAESCSPYYVPSGFWFAHKDYDGMPVNVHEHQVRALWRCLMHLIC